MSYTELDAWQTEKLLGDWPFERWDIGNLQLRAGYDYFKHPNLGGISRLGALHCRLRTAFGKQQTEAHLVEVLEAVKEVVTSAMEESDSDAFSTWMAQEIWLPVLDDSLDGSLEPADMLAQSIDYVGVPDSFSEQELLAGLGLWLIGECYDEEITDRAFPAGIFIQVGIAAAEAGFHRGFATGRKHESDKVARRTRKANDARHASNRARANEAEKWWREQASSKMSQADAARKIAARFNVVERVAGRWVHQFQQRLLA